MKKNKKVLILGASSDIGLSIIEIYLKHYYKNILIVFCLSAYNNIHYCI